MSMLFLAAMMMAQAPAAVQPEQPVTVKAKPKQVCEMVEVTGSRSRKRVCRDVGGKLDLGPGVHNNVDTRGTLTQQPVGHVGGPG
jgi:hypothetical protein